MALIITAGASNANSYADVTIADTYFDATGRLSEWQAIQEPEGLLYRVMRIIEKQKYIGSRATTTQALEFPRLATYQPQPGTGATPSSGDWTDKRGRIWTDDAVPLPIAEAQCEMAIIASVDDWWLNPESIENVEIRTGVVRIAPTASTSRSAGQKALPQAVYDLLEPFLSGVSGGTLRN
jgi:hypothetical protein